MHPAVTDRAARRVRCPASPITALTCGTSAVILSLYILSALVAPRLGEPWGVVAAALDPGRSGSLPELWMLVQLILLSVVIMTCAGRLGCRCLWRAALVPGVLLGADLLDAGARLAAVLASPAAWPHGLAPGLPSAKLLAGLLVGSLALAPALLPWRCSCLTRGSLARLLVLLSLLGGSVALGLDLLGHLDPGETGSHLLASVEEGTELLLYSAQTGLVLEHAIASARRPKSDCLESGHITGF